MLDDDGEPTWPGQEINAYYPPNEGEDVPRLPPSRARVRVILYK